MMDKIKSILIIIFAIIVIIIGVLGIMTIAEIATRVPKVRTIVIERKTGIIQDTIYDSFKYYKQKEQK
jgi:cell division septal protein FtsQ